jgi:hypothetical protein
MSGADVTIRGLDVSTFVTVRVAGRLQGWRVAGTDSNIFLCELREDFSSVTKEIYTAFFSSDFLLCIHTWTTCIIRRSSHQRDPQVAGRDSSPIPCGRQARCQTPVKEYNG